MIMPILYVRIGNLLGRIRFILVKQKPKKKNQKPTTQFK